MFLLNSFLLSSKGYSLMILILLLAFMIISCSSPTYTTPDPYSLDLVTQLPVSPTVPMSEKTIVLETLTPQTVFSYTPEATQSSTSTTKDIRLRVTFVSYDNNNENEIIQSHIWVLYPTDNSPQLLFSTQKGDKGYIISPIFWSHDNKRLAFAHLVDDEFHIAFSVFDVETKKVSQLTEAISVERPFTSLIEAKWSLDDHWLYVAYNEDFVHARIIDTMTNANFELDDTTQDELVAWSPKEADEYLLISRKSYPSPEGDELCLYRIEQRGPLKCFEDFSGYSLLSGKTTSWSPDGKKVLIVAGSDSEKVTYLLLDLMTMKWKPIMIDEYYEVFKAWSPDSRWVPFISYTNGLNILDLDRRNPGLVFVTNGEFLRPLGWLPGGQGLIYQDGYLVYAVNPESPEEIKLVEDYTKLLKERTRIPHFDLLPLSPN